MTERVKRELHVQMRELQEQIHTGRLGDTDVELPGARGGEVGRGGLGAVSCLESRVRTSDGDRALLYKTLHGRRKRRIRPLDSKSHKNSLV